MSTDVIPEPTEEEKRISDDLMAQMDQAIGQHRHEFKLKISKSAFTHTPVSAKKRAAKHKAERQNKRRGRG